MRKKEQLLPCIKQSLNGVTRASINHLEDGEEAGLSSALLRAREIHDMWAGKYCLHVRSPPRLGSCSWRRGSSRGLLRKGPLGRASAERWRIRSARQVLCTGRPQLLKRCDEESPSQLVPCLGVFCVHVGAVQFSSASWNHNLLLHKCPTRRVRGR